MPDYPVPDWPARIATFAELEEFLLAPTTVAIGKCVYMEDFFKHTPDIAPDQTAYTTAADRHATFSFFVFGRVRMTISELDNPDFFTLESSEDLSPGLKDLFAKQLEVLAAPVIEDDYWDDNPLAEPCTDSDRATGKGGSVLYVHPKVCAVHLEGVKGLLDHDFRKTFPVRNGDWVLVHATLHLRKDPFDVHPRLYILAARHVRRLCLLPTTEVSSSAAATTNAVVDVGSIKSTVRVRAPARSPSVGPSGLHGAQPEERKNGVNPLNSGAISPQQATPVKRSRTSESDEIVPQQATPLKRVRRSSRLMPSDDKADTSPNKRVAEGDAAEASYSKKRHSKRKKT